MTVQINCSIKWIAFTKRARTRHDTWCKTARINCIIERSYSSCYWSWDTFLLYDLFETWLLIRDYRTSIASSHWHDYSSQLFRQENCIYKTRSTLNASWYSILIWLFMSVVSSKRSHVWTLRYWSTFKYISLYNLFTSSWLSSCQCRCLLTDTWILDVCF